MRETSEGLLISRILVLNDRSYPFLRVELAGAQPGNASGGRLDPRRPPAERLLAADLARLAEEYGVEGLLFAGKRSAIGRCGLPRVLRQLRPQYSGWIGLEAIGPEPDDLRAVLGEPLLNTIDVQLAWLETDCETGDGTVVVAPSLRQVVSILLEARCPCVIRFTRPTEEHLFNEVSSAFDAFVRVSPEPVAVQIVEPMEHGSQGRRCAVGVMEFIACRPAWLVSQSQGQWYQVQPEGKDGPRAKSRGAGPRRRMRRF
jgi:hypothetical protein